MIARLLLIAATLIAVATAASSVGAAPASRFNAAINAQCRSYGYQTGTRDFAACRQNVRIYWSTGPCSNAAFAAVHVRYCNIVPEFDF
jgi:hypothetical protein